MEGRGWGDGGGAWMWRRRLLVWEEEFVSECASFLHNVVLHDNILTCGGGFWTLFMAILLRELTLICQRQLALMTLVCSKVCCRNKFHSRCRSLRRDYFAIDYQPKIISPAGESFSMTTLLAVGDAVQMKLHTTFSCVVIILVWCGTVCTGGWAFLLRLLWPSQLISISLVI